MNYQAISQRMCIRRVEASWQLALHFKDALNYFYVSY